MSGDTDLNDAVADAPWDVLDLLGVMADHIRLLIFLPLLAGTLGFASAHLWPRQYESVAILAAARVADPAVVQALVGSADMLRAVADKVSLPVGPDSDEALQWWRKTVVVVVGRQDKLVTLKVLGRSPEQAMQLNQAVIQEVLRLTRPRGEQQLALQRQLESEKSSLVSAQLLEAELVRQFTRGGALSEDKGRAFADVLQSKSRLAASVETLQASLRGLGAEDLVQAPSAPQRPVSANRAMVAVLLALATGALLLVAVLLRASLFSAQTHADKAQKIERIRRGLRTLWPFFGAGSPKA